MLPNNRKIPVPTLLLESWLIILSLLLGSCAPPSDEAAITTQDDTGPLFVDVSNDHLPTADLEILSMDARPADIDGDGDIDVIVANEHKPNILLLNDGNGRFSNVSNERLPQADHDSEDIGVADFDGDADLDIVVVSEDDKVNELYLNDGSGFFADGGDRLPVTGESNAVLVNDIDLDGDVDILIGNKGQNVILINDGRGFFTDETAQRLPPIEDVTQDIELGDIDGDGDLDLLVGNEDNNRLLLNQGQGIFMDDSEQRIPLREDPEETREADFGDVDGDGDLDILFANIQGFIGKASKQNRLLINDGQGFFTDATAQRLPADDDRSFDGDFIDVDGDGDLDIVTSNAVRGGASLSPYRVYLNDGNGIFAEGTDIIFPDGAIGSGLDVEIADFNGDGQIDLYLASRGSSDRLLLGIAR